MTFYGSENSFTLPLNFTAPFLFTDVCKTKSAFRCGDGMCIKNNRVCDQYNDCADNADELSCDIPEFDSCADVWRKGYRQSGYYTTSNCLCCVYFFVQLLMVKRVNALDITSHVCVYSYLFAYKIINSFTEGPLHEQSYHSINGNSTFQILILTE